jgi:hypothetical protein
MHKVYFRNPFITVDSNKNTKRMRVESFDKLSSVVLSFTFGFSFGVAVASWNWFPIEGDWDQIAEIPNNALNYIALLLPLILLLLYLLLRRVYFKRLF